MSRIEKTVKSLLAQAGIELNGTGDADIQVKNPEFYRRVIRRGSLGLGESYMDGWWEVKKLDEFFCRVLAASLDEKVKNWKILPQLLGAIIFNQGKRSKAYEIGEKHYDLGNSLFQNMLDKRMVYSCGYWKNAQNVDDAQQAKLDLICRKLYLKPGMKILDIGCGWGSFCKYAAENYGAEVFGISVSKEQVTMGMENCKGLNVKIMLRDYREFYSDNLMDKNNSFDRVVSLGMIEHVGCKNFRKFMKTVHHLLKEDGLFLLHTIGGNKSVIATDQWIGKYIFPNSMLPSIKQIGASIEDLFVMEDWHNFGAYYDRTLMAWFDNFERFWYKIKTDYDERFFRMWKYYLLSCAGSFRARKNQLWQIVLSKTGVPDGYQSIR
jgi:cyclopropane-fatty-acyl-phospholipid synthase